MSFTRLLPHRADVYRPTNSVNSMGAVKQVYTAVESDMLCRIEQLSAREREMAGQIGVQASHRLYCAAGEDVAEMDEVRDGSTIYDVTGVNTVYGARTAHHMEITLLERRPDRHER